MFVYVVQIIGEKEQTGIQSDHVWNVGETIILTRADGSQLTYRINTIDKLSLWTIGKDVVAGQLVTVGPLLN